MKAIEKQGGVQNVEEITKDKEVNEYKLVSGLLMKKGLSSKNTPLLVTQAHEENPEEGRVQPAHFSYSNKSPKEEDFYLISDSKPDDRHSRIRV
jgi:hypothetical protein